MFTQRDKRQEARNKDGKSNGKSFSPGFILVFVIAAMILNPMTRKGTVANLEARNSGHSRTKNSSVTFSTGLGSREAHKADIDERIGMTDARRPSFSVNEESICTSLDENMPLLLSILRGEKVHLYDDESPDDGVRFRTQSLIEMDLNGYQMPFASDIRVVAPYKFSSSRENGAKVFSIKGFNRDLIGRVFRKKHIYFIGDSTCRSLFVTLRRLLNYIQFGVPENQNETDSLRSSSTTLPDKYDGLNYDRWTASLEMLFAKAQKKWKFGDSLPPYMIPEDRTYLRILDVDSLYSESPEQLKSNNQTNLREEFVRLAKDTLVNPNVIIFTAGLHLLHLIPIRQLSHYKYQGWSRYESILETLLQVSADSQAPVILAKSTNRVCDSQLGPSYRKQARLYTKKDKDIVKSCKKTLKQQERDKKEEARRKGHNVTILSELQRDEICKYGSLSDEGSLLLNQRMSNFVDRTRTVMPDRLRYFNDHDIQSCNFTKGGDGRHYTEQVFVRLHLLAIMIDCMS